jgi:uncharacterized protein YcbK (DUF882 family)
MGAVPSASIATVPVASIAAGGGASAPAVIGGGASSYGLGAGGASSSSSTFAVGGSGPYHAAAAAPVNPAPNAVGAANAGLGLNISTAQGAAGAAAMTSLAGSSTPIPGNQAAPNGVNAGGPTGGGGIDAVTATMAALAQRGGAMPGSTIPVPGGGGIAVVGGGGGSSLASATPGASAGLNSMLGAAGGVPGSPVAGGGPGAHGPGCPHMGGANPTQQTPPGGKGAGKKKPGNAASKKKDKDKTKGSSEAVSADVKKWVSGDVKGLNPELLNKLAQMGQQLGEKIEIKSGLRSRAEQEKLYQAYLSGNGNLAAKPGTSNHESGDAADAYINGTALRDNPKAAALAKKLGLTFPVAGESWHVELG